MNPGKLDKLITLQSRTVAQGLAGDAMESFSTLGLRWAQLSTSPGSEPVDSQQRKGRQYQDFRIRSDSTSITLNHTSRVVLDGLEWDVSSIESEPPGRPEFLILKCWRNAE